MATVLLVIDMQNDFFRHDQLLAQRATLIAHINQLLTMVRASSIPVVWVKQEFCPDLSDASLEVKKGNISIVIAGTSGADLLTGLLVDSTDHTIIKKRYSAFFNTKLDELLDQLNCTQLIIAGVNTHACIRTTVIDAYQRDYEIILADDCISSYDKVHHEISWQYMSEKLGIGLNNKQIFSLINP